MNRSKKMFLISLLLTTTFCTDSENIREGYVTTDDGVKLYYCLVGSGADTVVVPAAAYLTREFKRLAPGRTFIFYDARNRGRSAVASDSTHLGIQYGLADLETLRQYFKIKRMSLIGWSYLGAMVVLYAAEHPERVDRIVQVDPVPPRKNPYWQQFLTVQAARMDNLGFESLQNMQHLVEEVATQATYRKMVFRLKMAAMLANPKAVDQIQSDYCKLKNESPENIEFVLSRMRASFGEWDWRQSLTSLLMPVLIIQGEQDPLPMDSAREWGKILPNARLLRIPDAGHLPFVEQPDIFYPAVEQFLNGEWPERSVEIAKKDD